MRRNTAFSFALLALCTCPPPARALVTATNLPNPTNPYGPLFYGGADSFTTGDQPALLNSVTVLGGIDPSAFLASYNVALWSDDNGHLGATLENLTGPPLNPGPINAAFASTGYLLQPHTTYWISFQLDAPNLPVWASTPDPTDTSAYGWTIGDQAILTTGPGLLLPAEPHYTPSIGLLQIDATILPEPSTVFAATACILLLPPPLRRRRPHSRPA